MATTRTRQSRTMVGVAIANAVTLGYGLARPESLAFSLPFLVAPSLVLLWSQMRGAGREDQVKALWVTGGVVALALVALVVAL